MKICIGCKQVKSPEEFHTNNSKKSKKEARCKPCVSILTRARYAADPGKYKAQRKKYRDADPEKIKAQKKASQIRNPETGRARSRRHLYGLTSNHFQALLLKQKNSCVICGFVFSSDAGRSKAASVDHDHATGRIRGLLCAACNHGLGKFKDSSTILRAAADYLEKIQ